MYNYKFGSKELQETGFYDFGARMLMTDIGRWATIDPLSEANFSENPYNYVLGNPINLIDPDGRKQKEHYQKPEGSEGFFSSGGGGFADFFSGGGSGFGSDINNYLGNTNAFGSGFGSYGGSGGAAKLTIGEIEVLNEGENNDCPTCPKNAKEEQTYTISNGKDPLHDTYVYRNGEWVDAFWANAQMGTVDIGPASGGKYLLKMIKNPNFVESSVKQFGKFWEYSAKIAGRDGSYTKYYRYFNSEGRTVKFFHDTYNGANQFLHREFMNGSERIKIWIDGTREWFSKWR